MTLALFINVLIIIIIIKGSLLLKEGRGGEREGRGRGDGREGARDGKGKGRTPWYLLTPP